MKASFFTESILYSLARGLSAALRVVPPTWGTGFGSGVGTLAYWMLPRRRTVALGNLKSAFGGSYSPGEYQRILKGMFRHFGMTLLEVARIPWIDRAYVDRWVQMAPGSREHLEETLAKGRGVIFITGHFGNWELISITGALHGYPTLVLAREQGWPKLNALLTRYRESAGCRVVTKGFPIRELIRGLEERRVVGILSDQDGGRNGVLAPFFKRLASTAPGAIALSLNTGAPVLPIFMVRRKGPAHTLYVGEPLKIPQEGSLQDRIQAGIAAYLEVLEETVRRYPAQWLWLHRRWKSSPQRRVLIFSDGKAGHRSQAIALSQRMEAAWKVRLQRDKRLNGLNRLKGSAKSLMKVETVEVVFRHPLARVILRLVASAVPRRFPFGDAWLRWTLTPDSYRALAARSADWSISCGSSTAAVNLLWAWSVGSKAIHIHRSRWPSWSRFALSLIPGHDRPPQPAPANVLMIDGALAPLCRTEGDQLQKWRQILQLSNGRQIGLLVGGPARGLTLEPADVERTVRGLMEAAEKLNAELLVTSSRRTPPAVEGWLQQVLGNYPRCRLLVLVNRREAGQLQATEEAIPCLFGLSQVLVVSGDSISMVSEAVESGKPVVSFLGDGLRTATKYHRFLQQMDFQGRIKLASPEKVGEAVVSVIARTPNEVRGTKQSQGMDSITEFLTQWL
ncbi:MAG: mitochondrial fission ELM1 family protein [Candidatus Omnitrophica bacterium]|nr:mitochondrial fission ELM1 family protein [Candidatus Omnitrophota bacterium]